MWVFYPSMQHHSFGVHILVYAACLTRIYKLNLGCLHPVVHVRPGDVGSLSVYAMSRCVDG
jgi:hypothetical protein